MEEPTTMTVGTRPERVAVLDLLRGFAVTGMMLVANTGDWAHTYKPLVHADWNGWTPADVVFPIFLFAVGMALGLSFPRALATAEERRRFWIRIARRMALLILLGLALNATYNVAVALGATPIGPDAVPALRYPSILARIALCYGLAAALIVGTGRRDADGRTAVNLIAVAGIAVAILLGYWALLRFVPVPGFGAGRLDQVGSLPTWIDRQVFGPAHMWAMGSATWQGPVTYDGEGLLGTMPSTANVLLGVVVGQWWKAGTPPLARTAAIGAALVVAGLLLDPVMPINKKIWTPSFAIMTGGWAMLALVALQIAARSPVLLRLMTPLRIVGANAVIAYMVSIVCQSAQGIPIGHAPGAQTMQWWIDRAAEAVIPDRWVASLACSLLLLGLIVLALAPLHRRAIHFRL
jgi:predicted acyltransferase